MQKAERMNSLLKQRELEGDDYWKEILKARIYQPDCPLPLPQLFPGLLKQGRKDLVKSVDVQLRRKPGHPFQR